VQWRRQVTWNPGELSWRVAALFMTGSSLFAIGSFPAYAQLVEPSVVGGTFVLGSLFFTAAGWSQFLQVVNDGADPGTAFRFRAWQPRRLLWWATVVQLIGMLFFNVSTIDATIDNLSTEQTNKLVWAPDFLGSLAFLAASHLGWMQVCRRLWCVRRDDGDWWIAAINYVGSIFFMASAIGAITLPTTDDELNVTLVNVGTFLGAVCFLGGAYLLLPPERAPAASLPEEPAPSDRPTLPG
jgi:hypothetical protein